MSSNYPAGYDNLPERTDASPATPNAHAQDHSDLANAVNAIEGELGLDPSGASATVKARLDALDTTVAGKASTAHAATHASAGSDPITIAESQVTNLTTDLAAKLVKASNLSDVASASSSRVNLGLGTSAVKDIPATGNASTSQVVLGTDTRLADSRTPTTHAATHAAAGSDPLTLSVSQVTGAEATANKGAANGYASLDATSKLPAAQLPTHASTHASAGSDPITIAESQVTNLTTDLAAKLVKASNLSDVASASSSRVNLGLGTSAVKDIPATGNASTSQVVLGTDTRLADSRTPTTHAATHGSAGSDPITIANTQVTGLGTMSTQAANSVAITGGSITGVTGVQIQPALLPFANTNYTVSATQNAVVSQTGTMSAPRTVTLPAASAFEAGDELIILDASGTVSATNTLTIQRAGADLIGGATNIVIGAAYAWRRLISDGVSNWYFDAGVLRSSNNLSELTATASTARTNLGLAIGTNVQAWDQDLADIAGLTRAKGDLIAGSATAWGDLAVGANDTFLVADSAQTLGLKWANASTSRTALGLGGAATLNVGTASSTVCAGDDSRLNTKAVSVYVSPNGTNLTTGVGKAYFEIPVALNNMYLYSVAMTTIVASNSGIPTFQVYRLRQGATPTVAHAAVAMLSTLVSVDALEYRSSSAATAAVIDTANNTVIAGDLIRFDCTVAGTSCQGVVITLTFSA